MYCKCSYLRVVVIYTTYVVIIKHKTAWNTHAYGKNQNFERVFNHASAYLIPGGIVCLQNMGT